MDLGIAGRTAVVCASTSGLGEGVARALGAEGVNVVVTGRRGEVARDIAAQLPSAVGVGIDLLSPGGPERLVEAASEAFGSVDILVLNGPGPRPGTALDVSSADIESSVSSLVVPQHRLVSLVLDGMRLRGWGRVLSIASTSVVEPIGNLALSTIGRAALAGYLKSLAGQVAKDGVTVNLLLPGRMTTARTASVDAAVAESTGRTVDEVRAEASAAIPMGRYGDIHEFGAVGAFLCSDLASYVTGTAVRCDGGVVRGL